MIVPFDKSGFGIRFEMIKTLCKNLSKKRKIEERMKFRNFERNEKYYKNIFQYRMIDDDIKMYQ